MDHHLAEVNIARLRAPLDSEALAGFVAALDPVNASADEAPGFVWRLQTEDGNATAIQAFEWDAEGSAGVIVNISVWTSIETLADWVYGPVHRAVLLQRRNWFQQVTEATVALWWVLPGHLPTTSEAEWRVRHLRASRSHALVLHIPPQLRTARRTRFSRRQAGKRQMDVSSLTSRENADGSSCGLRRSIQRQSTARNDRALLGSG